jgi:hypothetical protein
VRKHCVVFFASGKIKNPEGLEGYRTGRAYTPLRGYTLAAAYAVNFALAFLPRFLKAPVKITRGTVLHSRKKLQAKIFASTLQIGPQ